MTPLRTAKILFCAYGGGHIKALLPVIKAMYSKPQTFTVSILALTTAGPVLRDQSIPYLSFKDLIEPGDTEALAIGESLADCLETRLISREESVAYLGLSYADLINRLGIAQAKSDYQALGRAAFLPIGPIKRLFDRIQPDLIITSNSPRAEEAAVLVGRERNIPVICLLDLFASGPNLERLSRLGYADLVCVISESERSALIKAGREPNRVVVTGNPAFDSLLSNECIEAGKRMRASRNWHTLKIILWASTQDQVTPSLPREIEAQLIREVEAHENWGLLIRPHPNENIVYDALPPRVWISSREESVAEAIQASDVVITTTSTVGFESYIAGRPLITYEGSFNSSFLSYARMGISRGVNDIADLGTAVAEILASPIVPATTSRKPQMSATEHLIKHAMELLKL